MKGIVKILIVAYLQKCKQLLRFGLLYKIKVIEDTFRHREEFSNIFSSKVLSVIIVQVEFQVVKRRKSINEMGGNIPGGNFPGGIFPGGGGDFPRT